MTCSPEAAEARTSEREESERRGRKNGHRDIGNGWEDWKRLTLTCRAELQENLVRRWVRRGVAGRFGAEMGGTKMIAMPREVEWAEK